MKKITLCLFAIIWMYPASAQIYLTRTATISFFSKTPMEDIKAVNNQVYAAIDAGNKSVAFSLLLKGFSFRKEMMEEHFNEDYVESEKFPKATFSGSYEGNVDVTKPGSYTVTVKGKLSLHNTTREVEMPAEIKVNGEHLTGTCSFKVNPGDYNIQIPALVSDKIAKEITVSVLADCILKN